MEYKITVLPAVAAASAITGYITDPAKLDGEEA